MSDLIVVADCGGTNSRLQLWMIDVGATVEAGKRAPGRLIFEKEYANEGYVKEDKTFFDIYKEFLAEANHGASKVSVASIAVAGPVENNAVDFTNNNWRIDGDGLAKQTGIGKVVLMNDFVANGYGLLTLDEDAGHGARNNEPQDVRIIQRGTGKIGRGGRKLGAPIVCVGPGTGLGECFLTTHVAGANGGWEHYTAFPCEGGHTEFAPRTPLEFEMLQYLMKKFDQKHRVSVERVVSGRGLANIYEFLCQHEEWGKLVDPAVEREFNAAGDLQGKVVATNIEKCKACKKAMEVFIGAFGSEAGCCALKYLPFGGLYLAGGLTPKNLTHIEIVEHDTGIVCIEDAIARGLIGSENLSNRFLDAFRDKGRLSRLVCQCPVYAVMDQQLGQRGAHFVAVRLLREGSISETKPTQSITQSSSSSQFLAVAFLAGAIAATTVLMLKNKK